MGRSSVAALIARGQNQNNYNQTGISSNAQWIDFFNAALADLANDIDLRTTFTIAYDGVNSTYDLPDDFVDMQELYDSYNLRVPRRQTSREDGAFYQWTEGFYIYWGGANYKIVLYDYGSTEQTFNGLYTRLPDVITFASDLTTQFPELPTPCEDALIYYAIAKAMANNNLLAQSLTMMNEYEKQRKNIRDNVRRAHVGGW